MKTSVNREELIDNVRISGSRGDQISPKDIPSGYQTADTPVGRLSLMGESVPTPHTLAHSRGNFLDFMIIFFLDSPSRHGDLKG